jgi:hypothetical protein
MKSIKRIKDSKEKKDFIKDFLFLSHISEMELNGLCKLLKNNTSINGKYRTILQVMDKAMKKTIEEKDGKSTDQN